MNEVASLNVRGKYIFVSYFHIVLLATIVAVLTSVPC